MHTDSRQFETVVQAAAALRAANAVVVLTGAGISAESGVPVFRGAGGLWRTYRAEDLATPQAFGRDPALVWEWYRWRRERMADALPNRGHDAIARLEQRHPSFTLVTQNVDGLHARSGSRTPIELHGNIWLTRCQRCGLSVDESPWCVAGGPRPVEIDGVPICGCGGRMRPGVVWFGESLDPDRLGRAAEAAEHADVMLVVGTSAFVHPAASLPLLTIQGGGVVIEVNPEETPLTALATFALRGTAGELCPALEADR